MRFCLKLVKLSRICMKEFPELNWLNVYDSYLQFIVSDISKFYKNQCPDCFSGWSFCLVDNNGVKLPSCKLKLEMQSSLYVGPSALNKLLNYPKTTTSVNALCTTVRNASKRN